MRSIFKFAWESQIIPSPVCYGPAFIDPSAKTIRLARAAVGPRLLTRDEIHGVLAHCRPGLRAIVLLGINGGLGPTDPRKMPIRVLDLEGGWLNYPRHKTRISQRIPLWPETVETLRSYLAKRPTPRRKTEADLVFLNKLAKGYPINGIASEFAQARDMVRAFRTELPRVPGHGRMGSSVDRGDHVIFAKLDRGFRNTEDVLDTLRLWGGRGITIHSADFHVDRCNVPTDIGS